MTADPFERLHDVRAPVGEAWIGCRAEACVRVDNGQDAQLFAQGELVVDKAHRPDIVGSDGLLAVLTQLGFHTPLRVLVPQLQAQLIVNPARLLHVDDPALASQQDVNTPITIAHTRLCNLLDPPLNSSLVRPPGLVEVAGRVETDGPTGPPYRHAPVDAHPGDEFAQTARP